MCNREIWVFIYNFTHLNFIERNSNNFFGDDIDGHHTHTVFSRVQAELLEFLGCSRFRI
ncbi:hypothetical protein PUN28_000865 [Cardiocondyla obscurior]|uniref:Uncharacterized protein n=1 Tax=Cardiocondyla obscurior TaxID=286306 RepID=A0AAW2H1I1_9HYME